MKKKNPNGSGHKIQSSVDGLTYLSLTRLFTCLLQEKGP